MASPFLMFVSARRNKDLIFCSVSNIPSQQWLSTNLFTSCLSARHLSYEYSTNWSAQMNRDKLSKCACCSLYNEYCCIPRPFQLRCHTPGSPWYCFPACTSQTKRRHLTRMLCTQRMSKMHCADRGRRCRLLVCNCDKCARWGCRGLCHGIHTHSLAWDSSGGIGDGD